MLIQDVSALYPLTLPPSPGRSTGLHLSGLVKACATDKGLLDARDVYDVDGRVQYEPQAVARMCAGLAWEEWYGPMIARQAPAGAFQYHPGEIECDGVIGSPDGLQIDYAASPFAIVNEFKYTWRTSRTPVEDYFYWLAQIRGYLWMGMQYVRSRLGCDMPFPLELQSYIAFLHVYHVEGDYRGSGPCLRVHRLIFSYDELAENWAMLMKYRGIARVEI